MAYFNVMNNSAMMFRWMAAMTAVISLTACSVTYQFAPIEAWVVDAETGQPIEGAVVTANWELVKGGLDGPRYYGQLEVKETVTDASGRFYFDGFSKEDSSGAELRESDPQILIFKAGYKFERFTNDYIVDGRAAFRKVHRTAAVTGKRVSLARLSSDDRASNWLHSQLLGRLGFIRQIMPGRHETRQCYWQQIPRMIIETRKQELALKAHGMQINSLYSFLVQNSDVLATEASVKCIAPKILFMELQKP